MHHCSPLRGRQARRLLLLTGAASLFLGVELSAGGAGTGTRAKVTLAQPSCSHYSLTPLPTEAKTGPVTFVVTNAANGHPTCAYGTPNTPEVHELVVLKTNLPPDKIPLTTKAGFKSAIEVGRVAPALVVEPGQTRTVTLNLKPGRYVLICNILDHYMYGQRAAFQVVSR